MTTVRPIRNGNDYGGPGLIPDLAVLVEPLLIVRRVVREQRGILHRRLLAIVRDDDVCRRLMTIPGSLSLASLG
jgi:hypothetical protein